MSKIVMVVDDSSTVRKFLVFALRACGYSVLTARDGMDALEQLAYHPADLIITDLNMPKLDGFGLVRAIRMDRDFATVPIIILSSLTSPDDVDQGLRLGANAFVSKPLDHKRIQDEVARLIH